MADLIHTFPPLPVTKRGFGIHIDIHKTNRLAYGSYGNVVVRNLDDPSDVRIFGEHKSEVTTVRFGPKGSWIASGDKTGKVLVWDFKTLKLKKEYNSGASCVLDLAWTFDGKRIAAVGDGAQLKGRVFIVDSGSDCGKLASPAKILSVDGTTSRPFAFVFGNEDDKLQIYPGSPFKWLKSIRKHDGYVNCIRYSPNGEQFASCGSDSKIFLHDSKTYESKQLESKDNGHIGQILSLSWSDDSKYIITCSGDKTVKRWDVENMKLDKTIVIGDEISDQQVSCCSKGKYQVSVSLDGTVNILDFDNEKIAKKLYGHKSEVSAIAVTKDKVYTGCADGYLIEWDNKTKEASQFSGEGHGKRINNIVVDANGSVVTTGWDNTLRVSESKDLEIDEDGLAFKNQIQSLAASKVTGGLLVATTTSEIYIIKNKKIVATEKADDPKGIAISVDDKLIAVGLKNKVQLYSIEGDKFKKLDELVKHQSNILNVGFTPSGKFLWSSDKVKNFYFWDLSTKQPLNKLGHAFHGAGVKEVAFSPDEKQFVSGGMDSMIILWPTQHDTWKPRGKKKIPRVHMKGVMGVKFVDNTEFVTFGFDRTVKIWKSNLEV